MSRVRVWPLCLAAAGGRTAALATFLKAAGDTFYQLAATLEHVGSFVGEFASAVVHVLAAFEEVPALVSQSLTALVGLFGDFAPHFVPRRGSVQYRDRGADRGASNEPQQF